MGRMGHINSKPITAMREVMKTLLAVALGINAVIWALVWVMHLQHP
jgi:hypothetical protein